MILPNSTALCHVFIIISPCLWQGYRDVLCSKCAITRSIHLDRHDRIEGPSLGSIGHRFQITSQYSERARPHEEPTSACQLHGTLLSSRAPNNRVVRTIITEHNGDISPRINIASRSSRRKGRVRRPCVSFTRFPFSFRTGSLLPRSGFNAGFYPRFPGASLRKHRVPGSLSSSSSRTTFDVRDPNKHGAEPGI